MVLPCSAVTCLYSPCLMELQLSFIFFRQVNSNTRIKCQPGTYPREACADLWLRTQAEHCGHLTDPTMITVKLTMNHPNFHQKTMNQWTNIGPTPGSHQKWLIQVSPIRLAEAPVEVCWTTPWQPTWVVYVYSTTTTRHYDGFVRIKMYMFLSRFYIYIISFE